MKTRSWIWKLAGFAILVWLVFVTTPELRALLIIVDSLGLEIVFLLLAIQLRTSLPFLKQAFLSIRLWSCVTSFFALRSFMRLFGLLLPARAFAAVSALLYILSKSLWCPISQQPFNRPVHA
jgi:hypothetical protein